MNKSLPAFDQRKHFQSCQVEGGITRSHPVSSKTDLENQREYEYVHSNFTIIRNYINLKPLFKTSSLRITVPLKIIIQSPLHLSCVLLNRQRSLILSEMCYLRLQTPDCHFSLEPEDLWRLCCIHAEETKGYYTQKAILKAHRGL